MRELLKKFEAKKPEIVFEWKDAETEAEGWVIINSLRNGAAGGGTRMREGLDKNEVESLAKTMEVKFTVSGPPIGGAKSGINFNPKDPRKREVLERWYKAVFPLLKNYYGTGGDLNIDEIAEVIPITEEYGLWHPQEGVVNGFYQPSVPQKIQKLGKLRQGVSKILEDPRYCPSRQKRYSVADLITGYGVSESVKHYYDLWGGAIDSKRAIIQGWGNVASAAAYYMSRNGIKIVGIIDRAGGLINKKGFTPDTIEYLFLNRKGNTLFAKDLIPFEEINSLIWEVEAEILIPAASSRLLNQSQLEIMLNNKLELISSGANVPFNDLEIFYGHTSEYIDKRISLIPDFIANCGMARVFAYLMSGDSLITDEAIFSDVSMTIHNALKKINYINKSHTHLAKTAFEIALQQLV
jgi:glutamate dehydrogenase/leucine dehydrogenase